MTAAMTIIASKTIACGLAAAIAVAGAVVARSPKAAPVNNSMEQIYGSDCQRGMPREGEDAAVFQSPDATPDPDETA